MRNLRRPQVVPPTLGEGGSGFEAARRNLEAREADPKADVRTDTGHWNQADVRGALHAMHGPVCAYCQSDLERSIGDVDHFRPRSLYWWLAYTFDNYFLTCGTCNQHLKNSKFPIAEGALRTTFADRATIGEEQRLLLDPCVDGVEDLVTVDFAGGKASLQNTVDKNADPLAWLRVEQTIRLFELNVDWRLHGRRFKAIRLTILFLTEADEKPLHAEKLQRMASRFSPQGIFVRAVLERYRPDLLPTAEDELRWLVEDCISEYRGVREIPATEASPRVQRDVEMLRWALAVLWRDPPVAGPNVEALLEEADLLDEIRPLYEQLCD